jgi:hypothetical protein
MIRLHSLINQKVNKDKHGKDALYFMNLFNPCRIQLVSKDMLPRLEIHLKVSWLYIDVSQEKF